jgi:dUTP pyrophosphatase
MTSIEVPISTAFDSAIPGQGKPGDAGYDLSAADFGFIPAGERVMFGTGVSVAIPEGFVGYVKPRSGLAMRHGIDVLGGVVDSGYRGEIMVILHNTDRHEGFDVAPGDRIAQLVIQPVAAVQFVPVIRLPESERAAAGFGSTGVSRA